MAFIKKYEGKKGVTYHIRVSAGRDETGRRRTVNETYIPPAGLTAKQSDRAARKYADELEERLSSGANVIYDRLTFSEFVHGMYEEQHLSKLKLKTQEGYRETIKTRLEPYFGGMYLRKIRPGIIRSWLDGLNRRDSSNFKGVLTDTSKADWLRTLSAILGKAYEWELINENPCKRVQTPSKAKINVNGWQLEDVRKVLSKLPDYPNRRAQVFLLLALNTGLREAELAGLQWRDFDFENNCFSVNRTIQYITGVGLHEDTPKSMHGFRDIPINDELKSRLLSYREWQNEFIKKLGARYRGNPGDQAQVFMAKNGNPIYDSTVRKWLRDYCDWCGVPRITVHALRHTFASVLIANNVDARTAADILGHSSASLVLDVYADPQMEAKKRAVKKLESVYNGTMIDGVGADQTE